MIFGTSSSLTEGQREKSRFLWHPGILDGRKIQGGKQEEFAQISRALSQIPGIITHFVTNWSRGEKRLGSQLFIILISNWKRFKSIYFQVDESFDMIIFLYPRRIPSCFFLFILPFLPHSTFVLLEFSLPLGASYF